MASVEESGTNVAVNAHEGVHRGGDGVHEKKQEDDGGFESAVPTSSPRPTSGGNILQNRNRRRGKDPRSSSSCSDCILRVHVADIMMERDARLLDVAAELAPVLVQQQACQVVPLALLRRVGRARRRVWHGGRTLLPAPGIAVRRRRHMPATRSAASSR